MKTKEGKIQLSHLILTALGLSHCTGPVCCSTVAAYYLNGRLTELAEVIFTMESMNTDSHSENPMLSWDSSNRWCNFTIVLKVIIIYKDFSIVKPTNPSKFSIISKYEIVVGCSIKGWCQDLRLMLLTTVSKEHSNIWCNRNFQSSFVMKFALAVLWWYWIIID